MFSKKMTGISLAATMALTALTTNATAEDAEGPKRTLKGSMVVDYKKVPGSVDSLAEMFTEGMWYGRVRLNTFKWDWHDESYTTDSNGYHSGSKDNHAAGIGGSFIYKTARYAGVAATLGAYTSQNWFNTMAREDAGIIKAGKDTLSRYNYKYNGELGLSVIAEASVDVKAGKTQVIAGRQKFESVFTKSNDTKMIPNTFDGVVVTNKDIENTQLTVAHFVGQKLRDHTVSHDVITFKDANGNSWGNNDDSAIHKGLSYSNFDNNDENVDHTLTIASAKTKIGKDLKAELSYLTVPDVVNDIVLEAHYTVHAGDMKIIPGVRYFKQNDDGGGKIGGASLKGKMFVDTDSDGKWDANEVVATGTFRGYKEADSLDSSLTNVRVDFQPGGAFKFRLGYSAVEDAADIVAPWRGFPTGGFTRAMAQYNWYANTKTTMFRVDGNLDKLGLIPNTTFLVRYAVQDFDEDKTDVQADTKVIHTDWIHKVAAVEGLEFKVRIGLVDGEEKGTAADNSYNEYRFEANYLF